MEQKVNINLNRRVQKLEARMSKLEESVELLIDYLEAIRALDAWEKDGKETIPLDKVLEELGMSR